MIVSVEELLMNDPSSKVVSMRHLDRALDEIYLLRAMAAKEAQRIRNEEIPKARSHKRRAELLGLAERFEDAANGDVADAWEKGSSPGRFLKIAGASENLNFETWKAEKE